MWFCFFMLWTWQGKESYAWRNFKAHAIFISFTTIRSQSQTLRYTKLDMRHATQLHRPARTEASRRCTCNPGSFGFPILGIVQEKLQKLYFLISVAAESQHRAIVSLARLCHWLVTSLKPQLSCGLRVLITYRDYTEC